jgi:ribosomal protein S18 acetylase RimI-like enzyme
VESVEEVPPDDPRVLALYAGLGREADETRVVPLVPDARPPADLVPPAAVLLLVSLDGEPVAIGGVRDLDRDVAEIKAMYVAGAVRRRGLARRLLARLEEIAVARGCSAVRLDTASVLLPALALYESAGYERIPAYNENPNADLWFERELSRRRSPGP